MHTCPRSVMRGPVGQDGRKVTQKAEIRDDEEQATIFRGRKIGEGCGKTFKAPNSVEACTRQGDHFFKDCGT